MAEEIGAAGDAITGGLLARTVAGDAGRPGHGDEGNCLNCGTALVGAYCHACGQSGHVHRSLGAFWHDLLHGVLHFEGRIWRTLPMLIWRPGDLTRRYIHGERARFVSPMAMFLFFIFLMFAVLNIIGSHLEAPEDFQTNIGGETSKAVNARSAELDRELAAIDGKIAKAKAAGRNIGDLTRERATIAGVNRFMKGGPTEATNGETSLLGETNTGWARLDKGIAKARENPNLALYKVQTNAYKFSWALIPLSVPFVWILFAWHRKRHLYDHTIFVTYSLSFMSLLALVLTIAGSMNMRSDILWAAAGVIPPIHIYRQLKGAYEIGWFSALVRTIFLLICASIALTLFLLLLLGLGVLG